MLTYIIQYPVFCSMPFLRSRRVHLQRPTPRILSLIDRGSHCPVAIIHEYIHSKLIKLVSPLKAFSVSNQHTNTEPGAAKALHTHTHTFTQMCQYTQATTHGCGHPRTIALITKRCNDSQATGLQCPNANPPQVIADSKCWPCLQAQMGSQKFRDFILGQLVVSETSELKAGRGREDWIDAHRREREKRMAAEDAARVDG